MGESMEKVSRWYLHIDLDAFFASVEQLDNPELRGKPVIVGGKPDDRRSVVSTASYEARAFGVHSAMPTFQAYRLCPQGIFVHGRMHRYAELSHQIMNIFRDYSPDVDQMSIDEAFIDLTGTEKLFGPPEETARAIKARVKKETGLTVSVGLASTKYLAKIASGLSKPDGFFIIRPGTEENFMLNLPLNKVWGLGEKSLALIKSKGLNSTRDIYEKDFETLEFLFGKNMANFLYNVVRGIEKESFSRETKSHSISAETTFPYDLTDIYTIETELLELAHGVFFRLLKEESFSRTAFVKIRYEDFSTSTVQETVERSIITLDSFFEIIKRLFEKRYENGRGIRLLGVGFENVVKEDRPYQQELFSDNNDEKKQAVEKAILNLSKKHPEIKVSKARTLKAVLLIFMMGLMSQKAVAQEQEIEIEPVSDRSAVTSQEQLTSLESPVQEPPEYIFDYDINDKNHVDFSASGLWKIDLTSALDMTFGNGTETAVSPSVPIFTQETDISALLMLNNHWYFEAAFADEFTRNTFAFGYKGDNLIRHFRLANRGITLNEGYSAEHFGYSLRGGNNLAPGLSLELVSPSEKVRADFLVRYDMTETRSQIYYGMNKVSDEKIRAENFAYGREFRFPEASAEKLFTLQSVFVENAAGSYKDARGRKYRKLRSDEYSLAKTSGSGGTRLFLSQEAGGGKNADGEVPSILITFGGINTAQAIVTEAGSWNNEASFKGQIQKELESAGKYKLDDYDYELITELEGETALIIQNYEGFSPFLCPAVYSRGTKNTADYLVIADKSEMPVTKYQFIEQEEIYTKLYDNFFDVNEGGVRIVNRDAPESVYPFAQDCPEIYLALPQNTDLSLRARTYTPVNEIVLSKKAAAGTVQVYKNGYLLTGTVYNENTGVLELNQSVSDTDQLLITWQEEASDFSSGAVAAAAGVQIDFLPELKGDVSLTARFPVYREQTFIENGNQKNSFAALSTGITYEKAGFKLTEKTAVSLLNDNTAEGLSLYSWEEVWENYQDEKESNPNLKITEPQKTGTVSFSSQDFSPYKKITVELELHNGGEIAGISKENTTSLLGAGAGGNGGSGDAVAATGTAAVATSGSAPLTLIFDEDTGTSLSGSEAVYLELKPQALLTLPFNQKDKSLHTITISTDGTEVTLDETRLSPDDYILRINQKVIPSRVRTDYEIPASGSTLASTEPYFTISKITFSEAVFYGTVRNYLAAEYKNEYFDFTAESDQGSGSLSAPSPYVNAKAKANASLYGVKVSGDAALNNLQEKVDVSQAGHSIKTEDKNFVFRIISAEDSFRYKKETKELSKENCFAINLSPVRVPLRAGFKTQASDSLYHGKQSAEVSAEYVQKIRTAEIGLSAKAASSQKNAGENSLDALHSYAESWLNISSFAYSDGKENAAQRTSLYSAELSGTLPFEKASLTIKPKLTYELSDTYQAQAAVSGTSGNTGTAGAGAGAGAAPAPIETSEFSDKEHIALTLPFSKEKQNLSFEISRTGGGNQKTAMGGNYKTDTTQLFELQNERKWFYTSIPFYELFDNHLMESLSDGTGYSAKYEGNFRRSLYNSKKDLYIPSALTLALSRELTRQQPLKDLYQLKLIVTNNSVNNFGKNSAQKTFSWFTQEELTTSLSAILKIPSDEPSNFKINIQTYAQLLLFLTEKAVINEQLDFIIEDAANWNIKNAVSYSRPSKTSLLTALTFFLVPQAEAKLAGYSISRKDSLSVAVARNDGIMKQTYSFNHSAGIDFLDYFNINAGIGGTLVLNEKIADRFSLNLSLGAKAEF